MIAVDLFAGCGGAALGLERAGVHHLACVEWDADAVAVGLAAGLPMVQGDVREYVQPDGVAVDLLWASPPCQAWSSAGKRRGEEDERNGWPWLFDAVDRIRPTWLLAENVRGLIMGSARAYFDGVILPELRRRFAFVSWRLLDAADYGVPQRRQRVIIAAGPEPYRWPCATHTDPSRAVMLGRRPWRTIRDALPGLGTVVGGGTNPHTPEELRTERDITDEPSTTIPAQSGGSNALPRIVAAGVTGEGRPRAITSPSPTMGTKGTAYLLDRPAPSICVADGQGIGSSASRDTIEACLGRRRLTVEECAALQAFPADYPWHAARTVTARYRAVGNAVPPPLAEALGRALVPR